MSEDVSPPGRSVGRCLEGSHCQVLGTSLVGGPPRSPWKLWWEVGKQTPARLRGMNPTCSERATTPTKGGEAPPVGPSLTNPCGDTAEALRAERTRDNGACAQGLLPPATGVPWHTALVGSGAASPLCTFYFFRLVLQFPTHVESSPKARAS